MTTIVWDGELLVADQASWRGDIHHPSRKIRRHETKDHIDLIARLGRADFSLLIEQWWIEGRPDNIRLRLADLCDKDSLGNVGLVVIRKSRATGEIEIFEVSNSLIPMPMLNAPTAYGIGAEIAIGAMLAGLNARRAFRIVAGRSSGAAGGEDVLMF